MRVLSGLWALVWSVAAYRPIFCMHGIHDSEHAWDHFKLWIGTHHPGQQVHAIPLYNMMSSFHPLWKQAEGLKKYIRDTIATDTTGNFTEGYHLVCHSQGALTCRAVVETMDDHRVHTFVSLAGPQMGIYGAYGPMKSLWAHTGPKLMWRLVYTWIAQNNFSVANMWKDVMTPRARQAYFTKQEFLPELNNERNHTGPPRYAHNMIRLQQAYFFGGPDDHEIMPWQSTIFGYYTAYSPTNTVPMAQQAVYRNDAFGLRTLHESGRLHLKPMGGLEHNDWIHNTEFVVNNIVPLMV